MTDWLYMIYTFSNKKLEISWRSISWAISFEFRSVAISPRTWYLFFIFLFNTKGKPYISTNNYILSICILWRHIWLYSWLNMSPRKFIYHISIYLIFFILFQKISKAIIQSFYSFSILLLFRGCFTLFTNINMILR